MRTSAPAVTVPVSVARFLSAACLGVNRPLAGSQVRQLPLTSMSRCRSRVRSGIGPEQSRDWPWVLALLLLGSVLGETVASANTPLASYVKDPLTLPFLMVAYGCWALLFREAWARGRLGWSGAILAGIGYTAFNEGLVAHTWFKPGLDGFSAFRLRRQLVRCRGAVRFPHAVQYGDARRLAAGPPGRASAAAAGSAGPGCSAPALASPLPWSLGPSAMIRAG